MKVASEANFYLSASEATFIKTLQPIQSKATDST